MPLPQMPQRPKNVKALPLHTPNSMQMPWDITLVQLVWLYLNIQMSFSSSSAADAIGHCVLCVNFIVRIFHVYLLVFAMAILISLLLIMYSTKEQCLAHS